MNPQQSQTIDTIARILRDCKSVLFVTGAGISAESGVPTYRGIGGLYEVDKTEEGLSIERILSGDMLASRPELTWKYLGQIAAAARGATFNRAHEVIAKLEQRIPRVWTLTQNVDGFHTLAGSTNVIEIHGNMRSLFCMQCDFRLQVSEESKLQVPPRCHECDGILRPDVVLFGEMLPDEAMSTLRREAEQGFDAVICVGTSAIFPYIQATVVVANKLGLPTVEINPSETVLSPQVDYRLALGAAMALEEIWQRLEAAT